MLSTIKSSRWLFVIFPLFFVSQAFGHGMSEAEKLAILEGGNLQYLWIGASHMLSGYDHLLFVFGIVFFLTSFKDIVKYITVFTLGHSITLIYATFNSVQVNYFLIDAVIALSVCYIAFANLDGFKKYLNVKAPNLLFMITGLGLIHGLGLSTRLQQLPLNDDQLLMNIISFNVGIELGQVSALAIMLLLIAVWRKKDSFKAFSLITNYGLILAGTTLFFMQMHGYVHTTSPEEFVVGAAPALSQTKNTNKETAWKDTINIVIPARGEKEYKFNLAKDEMFEYSWTTDGAELFYDFHGEPAGDKTGYFKSFKKSIGSQSSGMLVTSFAGTHGWYWKNNTSSIVSIVLNAKGNHERETLNKTAEQKPVIKKLKTNHHDSL